MTLRLTENLVICSENFRSVE